MTPREHYEAAVARRGWAGEYTGKLFLVERRSAGDHWQHQSDWYPCGEADTLAEAEAISSAELALGWCSTRIKANTRQAEELLQAVERLTRGA